MKFKEYLSSESGKLKNGNYSIENFIEFIIIDEN